MNKNSFEIGDLVEFIEIGQIRDDRYLLGVVVSFKEYSDWDVKSGEYKKIPAVTVLWNSGLDTNTSPILLRKI